MKTKQKIRDIIKKIEASFTLKLIICIVLCFFVIAVFVITNNIIEVRNHRKYTIVDDIRLINSVESIRHEGDGIQLEGYAFILEKDSSESKISVFLRNLDTKDEIWLDMEQVDRVDVDSYYDGGYNYKNSGFIAYNKGIIVNSDEAYEIIINIDYRESDKNGTQNKRKTVSTNQYISGGELYSYNPIDFDLPSINIESDLLKKVFTNGTLCFYHKEEGIYVYQYNGRLYWIATDDFKFEENDKTYIIYHLYTSQVDKLRASRIKHKFDNLDFDFESYEYKEENTTPYRVAIRDIPEEYAITYIKTGVYNRDLKKSYWTKSFHLYGFVDKLSSNLE